ncbi:MAG: septation ring formation regulator EzrA [Bacilli bacterium]
MDKITNVLTKYSMFLIIIFVVLLVIVLLFFLHYKKRKYKEYSEIVSDLDKQKVRITFTPIDVELSKLNKVIKNKELLIVLNDWNEKWNLILIDKISEISDKILEIEDNVERRKFKNISVDVDECQKMIDALKKETEELQNEIYEVSVIEDRIREKVTKIKADFRNVKKIFVDNEALLYYMKKELDEKFDEFVNHVHDLELIVGANEYTAAEELVESVEEEVKVLRILVEKLPELVYVVKQYIPRKVVAFENMYKKKLDSEVYLAHLLFDEKIAEISKMIDEVIEKMKKLSFEDVEAEIDAISIFTDNLFKTLDDESNNFYIFNEKYHELEDVISDIKLYVEELKNEIEKVKVLYDLDDFDEEEANKFNYELNELVETFKCINEFPEVEQTYFELIKVVDDLLIKTNGIFSRVEESSSKIMSLRADEQRAREQMMEIQYLVDQTRKSIKTAKLPVVPAEYRVYVADAKDGIRYISEELDKVPIVVKDLNQRVETSLKLAYKLHSNTKKIIKESMLSEVAIIYGNRYRSNISNVDIAITKAEKLYYIGKYHDALNVVVNALEKTEPGIYNQLKKFFEKGEIINE